MSNTKKPINQLNKKEFDEAYDEMLKFYNGKWDCCQIDEFQTPRGGQYIFYKVLILILYKVYMCLLCMLDLTVVVITYT